MLKTQNYGFNKPELSDSPPDITVMNSNWDTIDKKIKENTDNINKNIANIWKMANDRGYENTKYLEANSDFNNIPKENGNYMIFTELNAPIKISRWYFVEVIKHNEIYLIQKAISFANPEGICRSYIRNMSNGQWLEWRETLTVKNISNPNLLINGDFKIWQRGEKFDFTDKGDSAILYTADRWQTLRIKQKVNKIKKGVNVKRNVEGGYVGLSQKIEGDYKDLKNKNITFTVDVEILIGTGTHMLIACKVGGVYTNLTVKYGLTTGIHSITTMVPSNIDENSLFVSIIGEVNQFEFNVISAKLELGDISTPFSPRLYGEELILCQRYFQRFNYCKNETIGILNIASTWINLMLGLSTEMRFQNPTIDYNCNFTRIDNNSLLSNFTNVSCRGGTANLGFKYSGSVGSCYCYAGVNGYIDLDAEIY